MNTKPARPFSRRVPGTTVLCLAALLMGAAPTVPDHIVARATATLATLRSRLGHAYPALMQHAKAVLIAPARHGDALLLIHTQAGWSEPAFFKPALNITSPAILLIMSDRALDAILRQHGLPLDGPDALTIATLDATPITGAELLLWSSGAKPRLDSTGPTEDATANTAWYGHPRGAAEIVGGTPPSPRTAKLRAAL